MLILGFTDGYFQIKNNREKEETRTLKFSKITSKLPNDIQEIICNMTIDSSELFIDKRWV